MSILGQLPKQDPGPGDIFIGLRRSDRGVDIVYLRRDHRGAEKYHFTGHQVRFVPPPSRAQLDAGQTYDDVLREAVAEEMVRVSMLNQAEIMKALVATISGEIAPGWMNDE